MASKNYIKYARAAFSEPQSYYLASGSSLEVFDELRRLGTKRVLFLCNKTVSEYRNFTNLVAAFDKNNYRTFKFIRNDGALSSSDIIKGLSIYKEFNCDTVVAVGGTAEIDCGKMISAMQTNNISDPMELVGLDMIKTDISVLCCIVTDNSVTASSSFAEFFDTSTGKLHTVLSAYLIPQVVVIDTDIAMRTDIKVALDQALASLGVAIEAYISPVASLYPTYRANAVDACRSLFKYIDLMMESPDESYYRRRLAVGGLYAGLSSRMTGYGISHITGHALINKYGEMKSSIYLHILSRFFDESDESGVTRIAEFAREIGVADKNSEDRDALESLVQRMRKYLDYYSIDEVKVPLTHKETNAIVSSVLKEVELYGFDNRFKPTLERILNEFNSDY